MDVQDTLSLRLTRRSDRGPLDPAEILVDRQGPARVIDNHPRWIDGARQPDQFLAVDRAGRRVLVVYPPKNNRGMVAVTVDHGLDLAPPVVEHSWAIPNPGQAGLCVYQHAHLIG